MKLPFTLQDFWRWSASDLVSNATRGRLAEFIVARALNISTGEFRDEWAAYDLITSEGVKIEVKSAAYIQSWSQARLSKIVFSTKKTRSCSAGSNGGSNDSKRQADIYVFALLAHVEKATIDALNLDQWKFYTLPTRVLDERERSQHSITLKSLEQLSGGRLEYSQLAASVEQIARAR
ncbi:MAG: hypothetical protein JNK23_20150 [Opitutaceae bacterium]|nr:hypothetical protein [Opitutaceae bacterium]